jgi:hypothetical protein
MLLYCSQAFSIILWLFLFHLHSRNTTTLPHTTPHNPIMTRCRTASGIPTDEQWLKMASETSDDDDDSVYQLKAVVLGESNAGKTALVRRFVYGSFASAPATVTYVICARNPRHRVACTTEAAL